MKFFSVEQAMLFVEKLRLGRMKLILPLSAELAKSPTVLRKFVCIP